MRIIAGKARGINLAVPQGRHTRPTTGRIKETLFNIIQAEVPGSRFLDLYSGSGSIALEALSRGAAAAVLVDNDREAVRCIKENIKKTVSGGAAQLIQSEAMYALKRLDSIGKAFDIIFLDPPYNHGIEKQVIGFLSGSSIVKKDTLIIAETSIETDISYLENPVEGNFPGKGLGFTLERVKRYKTNKHLFLRV